MNQILVISSVLLWLVVLFNLLLTLALIRRRNIGYGMMDIPKLKVGQSAPDFTAETLCGEAVTLATYSGRAVAFIFLSPDCGPCREIIPTLETLQPQARQSGIELVLVSQADPAKTQIFVSEHNVTLPVLVAPRESNSFRNDYKVAGTPFYCCIDAAGKVQTTGFLDDEWEELTRQWGARSVVTSIQTPVTHLAVSEGG